MAPTPRRRRPRAAPGTQPWVPVVEVRKMLVKRTRKGGSPRAPELAQEPGDRKEVLAEAQDGPVVPRRHLPFAIDLVERRLWKERFEVEIRIGRAQAPGREGGGAGAREGAFPLPPPLPDGARRP